MAEGASGIDRARGRPDDEAARPVAVAERPAAPDAAAVVGRLRATFDTGRTRPAKWRRAQLEAVKRILVEHEREFLDALAADLGKPAIEGWLTDIVLASRDVDHTLKHMASWMRPERVPVPLVQRPASARVVREPLGVVLVMRPGTTRSSCCSSR